MWSHLSPRLTQVVNSLLLSLFVVVLMTESFGLSRIFLMSRLPLNMLWLKVGAWCLVTS